MLSGPTRSKLLLTGIELEIFNQLSESRSADAITERPRAHRNDHSNLYPSMKGVIFDKSAPLCQYQ